MPSGPVFRSAPGQAPPSGYALFFRRICLDKATEVAQRTGHRIVLAGTRLQERQADLREGDPVPHHLAERSRACSVEKLTARPR